MSKIQLEFTHNQAVASIRLCNGRGNVIDRQLLGELNNTLASLRHQPQIKLLILEGTGEHFSYGASVEEHVREQVPQMLRAFHEVFYRLNELCIPTLAGITGCCLGGGLELALMANFLFADRSARMGQPEITLGVFPPPASLLLPLKLGQARAEELLLTGKTISADEALQSGLINAVYEDRTALDGAVQEFIEKQILPKSASSLRMGVRAARMVFSETLLLRLPQLERLYLKELMATEDANEGIAAFLEKRKPQWKNA